MKEVTLFIHHEYGFILLLRPLTCKKQNEGIHRVPLPLHLQVHHLILHSLSSGVEVPLLYSKCAFGAVKENIHKSTLRIMSEEKSYPFESNVFKALAHFLIFLIFALKQMTQSESPLRLGKDTS